MASSSEPTSKFINLPQEIRHIILKNLLQPDLHKQEYFYPFNFNEERRSVLYHGFHLEDFGSDRYRYEEPFHEHCSPQILQVCRTLHQEGTPILYGNVIFVFEALPCLTLRRVLSTSPPVGSYSGEIEERWADNHHRQIEGQFITRIGINNWSRIRHIHISDHEIFPLFSLVALSWLLRPDTSILSLITQLRHSHHHSSRPFSLGDVSLPLPHLQSIAIENRFTQYKDPRLYPLDVLTRHILDKDDSTTLFRFAKLNRVDIIFLDSTEISHFRGLQRILATGILNTHAFLILCLVHLIMAPTATDKAWPTRVFEPEERSDYPRLTLISREKRPARGNCKAVEVDIAWLERTLEEEKAGTREWMDEESEGKKREMMEFLGKLEGEAVWTFMWQKIW